MKLKERKDKKKSFKSKLLICFVISSVIPIILSCIFLIQSMSFKVKLDYRKRNYEIIKTIEERITDTFTEIEAVADSFAQTEHITEALSDNIAENKYVYNKLYELSLGLRDRAVISIFAADGSCLYTTGDEDSAKSLPLYCGILKSASAHPDGLVVKKELGYDPDSKMLLRSVKAVKNKNDEIIGYFSAGMGESELEGILKGCCSSMDGLCIFNEFLEPIYTMGMHGNEQLVSDIRNNHFYGEISENNYPGNTLCMSNIEDYGLYAALIRPDVFTEDITKSMYLVLIILAVLTFLLCFIISNKMSSLLYRPVDALNKGMLKVREGDLNVSLEPISNDEFGHLTESFNEMLTFIRKYTEEQVRQQQKLNETETAMMQAQLNPHFLYNTLDTIKWAGKANGLNEVSVLSTRLAKILRAAISADKVIKLRDELKLVEYYAEIQEIRFEGRFRIDDRIPEELRDCLVPKLVIQPIVENSVIHGFKDSNGGNIIISGRAEQETLVIEVADDGCGMTEEMTELLNSAGTDGIGGHIGFCNVKNIIKLNYGNSFGVRAERNEPCGTRVIIRLPLMYKKINDENTENI